MSRIIHKTFWSNSLLIQSISMSSQKTNAAIATIMKTIKNAPNPARKPAPMSSPSYANAAGIDKRNPKAPVFNILVIMKAFLKEFI